MWIGGNWVRYAAEIDAFARERDAALAKYPEADYHIGSLYVLNPVNGRRVCVALNAKFGYPGLEGVAWFNGDNPFARLVAFRSAFKRFEKMWAASVAEA